MGDQSSSGDRNRLSRNLRRLLRTAGAYTFGKGTLEEAPARFQSPVQRKIRESPRPLSRRRACAPGSAVEHPTFDFSGFPKSTTK